MGTRRRKGERPFEEPPLGDDALMTPGRPDRYHQRLDRILAAAVGVIARDGFDKASMREIARASKVSLAGLYHYLDSKEHLLFLIQFRAFSALLTEVQSRLSGVEDPEEQLRVLVRTHVQFVARSMGTLKVCSHELDSLGGEGYECVRRIRREYYDLVRNLVARLLRDRADAPGLDPRIATMCLFGTLNWLYRWYDPQRDRSPTSLANHICAQFLEGLRSSARRPRRDDPREPAAAPSPNEPSRGAFAGRGKELSRASSRHRAARAG